MKHFLVLLASAALLGLAAFSFQKNGTALVGKITDETGSPLVGAEIRALNNTDLAGKTTTDTAGAYHLELAPGTYTVDISAPGRETHRIVGVPVLAKQANKLHAALGNAATEEVVVRNYRPARDQAGPSDYAFALSSETGYVSRARPDMARKVSPATEGASISVPLKKADIRTAKPASTAWEGEPVKIKDSKREGTDYYIDGVRSTTPPPAAADVEPALLMSDSHEEVAYTRDEPTTEPLPHPGVPSQPKPRAGLLTAGEWNDLHNWNTHWADLLKDGETDQYQKMYQFFPKNRYSVLLQTEDGLPVSDAIVQLYDQWGILHWEARTSNTGMAELWQDFFKDKAKMLLGFCTAEVDGKRLNLGTAFPYELVGLNQYKIKRECQHAKTVDIVWTVDATGSMGDELEYLKTELLDVIGRVRAANPGLDVRTGSVFYRDEGDDYVVKSSALNHDAAKTVDYIRKQSAGGGGDYPEAVHSALEETLRQPWSREAVARICFLVLDASPHQRPEVLESLKNSIREAAKRGIRIVPLSASGIQKDTEFLMKFFGLATNGSYVFLTDHSGIGGKHLAPTTDEYKMEPLNSLLVRLITEYTTVPTCEGKSSIQFVEGRQDPQSTEPAPKPVLYYPNPAVSQFSIELPFEAEKLTLYDSEGKAVRSLEQVQAGLHSVLVHDLPPGFYTLRIWKNGQVQSGKVLVVRT
ncbi:MAG: carboxypeptidase regulatory-like domain-containing protein [Saprospiraceae bacterium]